MKTKFQLLFSLFAVTLFFSCKPGPIDKYLKIIPEGAKTFTLGFADTLAAYYTGCGGLVLKFRGEQLLFDPFFSNTAIKDLKKLKSNSTSIEGVLYNMQLNGLPPTAIKNVFIAHSHYDHLYDLPYLLQKQKLNPEVTVYGSNTTKNVLDAALDNNLYHFNLLPNKNLKPYGWIDVSPHIRVLPIKVAHNPHALHSIKVMCGNGKPGGIKDFDTHNFQSNAYKWKEGNTYAFLVELTTTNGEKKKVYIQSSSTKVMPPQNYLFQLNKVDLAFICIASSTQSVKYPKDVLSIIQPKKTVLIHWEDFFITYSHNWRTETAKTIRGTKMDRFFKRYNNYHQLSGTSVDGLTENTLMPMPGTMMYFK